MATEYLDAFATEVPEGAEPRARRLMSASHAAVLGAVVIAALLVVLLIYRVGRSNDERDKALTWERHSYEVMLGARSAEASMASAEAALGRFSISADRTMGSIYYNDWVLAGAQIDRLSKQVGGDPDEAALVAKLQTLYAQRSAELGLPAQEAAQHQGWAALNSFNAAGHSSLIAETQKTLEALRQLESDKLTNRYDWSDTISTDSSYLAGLLSITGLALIGAAGGLAWLVTVAAARRRYAEEEAEEAAERTEWLREAVAEATVELSDMNARLQAEMQEREAAEAQLRQMQKMDAVGQLTGGIAHDFNNMLAVVVGGIDLARRRLDAQASEVSDHLDRAMEGADRAAALTRRLLGFARAEPLLPEPVRPGALIAGMSDLVDRTLGERIQVETRIAPDCWPIWVDPLQLENAILNLAVNGRDAMDGAGAITITADNATLHDGEVGALAGGDYARISVTDTGSGMTPEVLERVFEPFFTTKEIGKGTGLGMSQIFGFVRQSGGEVAIRTAPGKGTTVTLYLPRSTEDLIDAPVGEPAPVVPIAAASLPVGLPVLVVEDDPRVRASTVGALEELGYRPVACDEAEQGLATLDRRPDIEVVITDVVMPGMTGPELAQQIRLRHPHVELLFVTGYSGEDGGDLQGEALLRKPFTVAQLETTVAAAFARAALSAPHRASGAVAAA